MVENSGVEYRGSFKKLEKNLKNVAQYRKSSGLEYFEENLDKWSKTAD